MRPIKDIVKDIKEAQRLANIRIDDLPYAARQGTGIAKRTAQDSLPGLVLEFKNATIPNRLVAVFADGNAEVISKTADFLKENGGLVIDANLLYRQLAKPLEATYAATRIFGVSQFSMLVENLADVLATIGEPDSHIPRFVENTCPDEEATVEHIRNLIRAAIGDAPSVKFLSKEILQMLLDSGSAVTQIPILVVGGSGLPEKSLISTIFSKSFTYKFTDSFIVDKKSVVKLFKTQQDEQDEN